METRSSNGTHSAGAAALGFYYQAFFALLTLLEVDTDDAAIALERLDDVELQANGQTLLYQLKHSIGTTPPPVSLKSRALWKTFKAWIDILPSVNLSQTTLHLVSVGAIPSDSALVFEREEERERLLA